MYYNTINSNDDLRGGCTDLTENNVPARDETSAPDVQTRRGADGLRAERLRVSFDATNERIDARVRFAKHRVLSVYFVFDLNEFVRAAAAAVVLKLVVVADAGDRDG